MGFNKIPLALRFNDTTGNIEGLQEFNIDEAVDLSGLSFSSLSGISIDGITDHQALIYTTSSNSFQASTIPTGGGGGTVNLSYTAATGNGTVTNSAGADAVITAADSTNAGLFLPAEKTKLAGVETSADVTDATNVAAAGALMTTGDVSSAAATTFIGNVTFNTIEQNSIMVAGDASAVSSVSGVSGSLVYFSGPSENSMRPVLTGIDTILTEKQYTIAPGETYIQQQTSLSPGDILIVPEGATTFTNHVGSAALFTEGIASDTNIAKLNANANFTEDLQRDGKNVLVDPTGGSTGDVIRKGASTGTVTYTGPGDLVSGLGFFPSSVGTSNQVYFNNAGTPGGLTTTTASRHFINLAGYDTTNLEEGAQLVWSGTGDSATWAITTEGGTGAFGSKLAAPAGTTGKSGSVTTNSLILVSGTSVSATRAVTLGSNALEFLDNNASAASVSANDLNVTTNITVGGTVDGVDIASRDAVLTSTTTTANNALPKAGGTMTGTLQIDAGVPKIILKDTTDDDDHSIVFRSNGDVDEFVIRTGDKVAGLGDNFQLGSTSNNGLTLMTNNAVGLLVDAAQNVTCSGSVSSASVTGVDVSVSGNLNATYTTLANAGITTTLHREVGAPVASSNSTSLADLASYTLPANILTLGDIDIMIRGRQRAQGSNLRWNFKIAGTNILNSAISQGTYSDFTRYTMHIQISKMATDRQMVTARFIQGTGTGSAAGFSGWSSTHRDGLIHAEATGDESGTLALSLEAQQSDAAQTVSVDQFTVKLIPNAFA